MRMDRSGGRTAAELLRDLSESELAALLRRGDEPHARRIAAALVARRREAAVTTTADLARIVSDAKPPLRAGRGAGIHPATLTFQALRMVVNEELEGLDLFVRDAVGTLAPGGRLCVIAFHSGEDAAVKNALKDLAGRCTCPAEAMRCECGRVAQVRVLTRKPLRPSDEEVAANPRARSARVRAAERTAVLGQGEES